MSYVEEEIASQPEVWLTTARLVASGSVEGLPLEGERVAVIGCGTSFHGAQTYAAFREQNGHGETDVWHASEFPQIRRRYDRVLAITRTGTTTEVIKALEHAAPSTATTVITADASSTVAGVAAHTIALDFADERAVVQTRFATSALMLLRAHLGEDIEPFAAAAKTALATPLPEAIYSAKLLTFLGTGWRIGVVNEASHKLRETAQIWTDSYSAMEYRHGANCLADENTFVWLVGEAPPGLVEQVRGVGATAFQTGDDPMVDLVRVHSLAVKLAVAKGLDPDRPRNLARSIILT